MSGPYGPVGRNVELVQGPQEAQLRLDLICVRPSQAYIRPEEEQQQERESRETINSKTM